MSSIGSGMNAMPPAATVVPPSGVSLMADAGQLSGTMSQAQQIQQVLARSGQINQALVRSLPAEQAAQAALSLANSQAAATQAFENLQNAMNSRNPALIALASAQATASTASLMQQQNNLAKALQAADSSYRAENPAYAAWSQRVERNPMVRTFNQVENSPAMGKILSVATGVGAAAGTVVGGLMLPSLVKNTETAYRQLQTDLSNQSTTRDQKLTDLAGFSHDAVGTVETVEGMKAGAVTLTMLASNSVRFGGLVTGITHSWLFTHTFGVLGGIMDKIMPFADAGMLAADSLTLVEAFRTAGTSTETKVRDGLNVGLDALKVITHFLPFSPWVLGAYLAASLAQIGLIAYDLCGSLKARWSQMGAQGQANPAGILQAAGGAIHADAQAVGSAVSGAIHGLEHLPSTIATDLPHWMAGLESFAKTLGQTIGVAVGGLSRQFFGAPGSAPAATPTSAQPATTPALTASPSGLPTMTSAPATSSPPSPAAGGPMAPVSGRVLGYA